MGPFNKSLSLSLMVVVLTIGANLSGCAYSPREVQSEDDLISPVTNQISDARQLIVNQELVASISYQSDEIAVYVPVAPIVDALGWTYVWNEKTKSGTIQKGESVTSFTIGNRIVYRDGYPIFTYRGSRIIGGEAWLNSLAVPQIIDVDYAGWNPNRQEYRVLQFPKPDRNQTDLEKAAVEEVLQHLQVHQIELTRSPLELTQMPENIRTKSVQQLADLETTNDGLVKVVVEFTTDYQPSSEEYWLFGQPGKTRYEQIYQVSFKEGQASLDLLSERTDRTALGSPVPFLDDSDFAKISEEWRKNNFYSLPETLKILDTFVKDSDNGSFSSLLARVNTQNLFYLPELDNEEVLNYFSESTRNSSGWEVFLSLEGARDPGFTILSASSTKGVISAKIIGNWTFDGVNMKPILLDADLTWDGENWRITRFENVQLYENVYELSNQTSRLYEKIAEQYIFRTVTRFSPFYL